jgi:predicted  nucleic acid-binding Zn-ribbon protein
MRIGLPAIGIPTLLLLALAAAVHAQGAWLLSNGPYALSTAGWYLAWYPPYAVPMNLTLINVTWYKPNYPIWFRGTYDVVVCSGYTCEYKPATIYVVQYGLTMVNPYTTKPGTIIIDDVEDYVRYLCRHGAMVAPINITVLNLTTQIWVSDVYCLDYDHWYWLRWLPYDLPYFVNKVEFVNASGIKVVTPIGSFYDRVPAGWYLDPVSKAVFQVPGANLTLLAELQSVEGQLQVLESQLASVRAELGAKSARLASANATIAQLAAALAQLNATVAQLNASLAQARASSAQLSAENQALRAQLDALNATRARLEAEASLYRSQLGTCRSQLDALQTANATLTAQVAQLSAENQALRAQAAELNESLARLNETYASQASSLQARLEASTRDAWIGTIVGVIAGAAASAVVLRRRR